MTLFSVSCFTVDVFRRGSAWRTHRICSPPVRSKQVRNIPKRIVRGHSHPECVKAEAIEIGFVLIAASVNGTISFLHYLDCAQGRKIWREIVIIELSCRDYDRLLQLPFTHFNHTHTDFLWTVLTRLCYLYRTCLKQESVITVQGVPLTSYMETLIVNSASANAHKVSDNTGQPRVMGTFTLIVMAHLHCRRRTRTHDTCPI